MLLICAMSYLSEHLDYLTPPVTGNPTFCSFWNHLGKNQLCVDVNGDKNNKLTWMCLSATQNVLLHRSVLVFTPPWWHLNRLGLYVVLRSPSIVLGGSNKHPNQCMQFNLLNLIQDPKSNWRDQEMKCDQKVRLTFDRFFTVNCL